MRKGITQLSVAVFAIAVTFSGCATKDISVAELEEELRNKEKIISKQEQDVASKNDELARLKDELSKADQQSQSSSSTESETGTSSLVPPNAKTGECYARALSPEVYETKTEKKLLTEKVEHLNVTEPTFKDVTYKIVDKAESFKYVLTPATYKCQSNRIMVKPEKVFYKVIPATFKEVEEKVLVSKADKYWKKGTGPITKIDNTTGEIMCLVEKPAKYKIVKTKVIDEPARTEEIIIPAEYKNIKTKVVDTEASYEKVIIPATYKTVTVQELDKEATVNKTETPATYQTVESTYLSKVSELRWERILCETNTNEDVITKVQKELNSRNYNAGIEDGVYGVSTQKALNKFQKDNKLTSGALTLEALEALGIK